MRIESTEVLWLEEHQLTLAELADLSGLSAPTLAQLLDIGAIAPLPQCGEEARFGSAALQIARTARRLQSDFELDLQGLTLALGLLERIADLEGELQALRARMPRGAQS